MEHKQPKVWFITGTSSGFGFHLVNSVLARGDYAIATARDLSKIENVFPPSDHLEILQLDVTDGVEHIKDVAKRAASFWDRIDVLVNNAGYDEPGLFEEAGSEFFKKEFQTNVFGMIDVTVAFLPYMRQRRSGIIVQVGSRLSWYAELPGRALYCSSKAAVRAFSETLAAEVSQFSIKVLIFEPGGFRTPGILSSEFYTGNPIPDYDKMREECIKFHKDGPQKRLIGDPKKGMEFLVDIVKGEGKAEGKDLPRYLVCGPGANESVKDKCEIMNEAVAEWEWVTKDLLLDDP